MGVKLLGRYTVVPRDLFRTSAGSLTRLRDKSLRPGAPSWDVMTIDGKVQPLGMTSDWYQSTTLPEDLILIHERGEHHSLQASREMTLDGKNLHNCVHRKISPSVELNSEVTSFLNDEAIRMTKKEWHAKFPTRTD
ncbi:hypothetical protein LTR72_008422 [Exophiala xenobiotica]|nr:hypothetical protein LTR92_009978 [Exophiala xenobiotica]KAK5219240.1 hypothetical protein LTR72_008422 [Exophiala xenobiotica]KAK5291573.1 hypothetical protein LTR14_006147 [Exophiala xenobiotica]KAK5481755.1 hypothetical protein LTR55_006636 [Exophiala xenobiotica]